MTMATKKPIQADDVWAEMLGPEDGLRVKMALSLLKEVDPEGLQTLINNINATESMGPIMDPSAWLDGTKFNNSQNYKQVVSITLKLVKVLSAKCRDRSLSVGEQQSRGVIDT